MRSSVRILAAAALAWLGACADAPTTTPAADAAARTAAVRTGPTRTDARDRYIVVFEDRVASPGDEAREMVRAHGGTLHFTYERVIRGFAATLSPQAAEALGRNPNVRYVEADQVVRAAATQTGAPWGLDRIDQRALAPLSGTYTYTAGATGQGVNAYVIDSGIRFTHAQFGGRAVPAADFVQDLGNGNDCTGHGTHVAGILGGSTYGVAKSVKLHSVRVVNCYNEAFMSAVVAGIEWVRDNHVKPAVANLGFTGLYSLAQDDAVKALLAAGVTVVSPAGNENNDVCFYSSAYIDGVITAGATDATDTRWPFSNWGHCIDVFAPGVDITSAVHYDDASTTLLSGTSMAAPHVAGAVARFLQTKPAATPAETHAFIVNNATAGVVTDPGYLSPNKLLYVNPTLGATYTTITGSSSISTAGSYTWLANASGGNGTFTYAWEYRVQGGTWAAAGTGSSYTRSVAAGNPAFELRVTVTSGGVSATDNHLVAVTIPTVTPPAVTIAGPTAISTAGTSTWTTTVTGGNGTNSYAWDYRVQGSATWTAVGTASSYSRSVAAGNPSFELRVTVTSGGLSASDTHLVSVTIPQPPTAAISGATAITTAGSYTWQANAAAGNGTYTYAWEYRVQGSATWTAVGTASSYTRTVSAGNPAFELRVTVTSGGLTGSDTHLVSVNIVTPLAAVITGPDYMIGGESDTWYANASGGAGSYTYQWAYRTAASTTWTNVGTGSSYTRAAPLKASFYLRVTVTSGTVTATDEHYVQVEPVTIEPTCRTCVIP